MAKLHINKDEINNKIIPNLQSAVQELNNAINNCNLIKASNIEYYNKYLNGVISGISSERDSINRILDWIIRSNDEYTLFNEENTPYIDKCFVSEINTKIVQNKTNPKHND